jgi:hypothetical protein
MEDAESKTMTGSSASDNGNTETWTTSVTHLPTERNFAKVNGAASKNIEDTVITLLTQYFSRLSK